MRLLILSSCVSGGGAGRSLETYFKHIDPSIEAHVVVPEEGVVGETLSKKAKLWIVPEFVERIHRSPYKLPKFLDRRGVHLVLNWWALPKAMRIISEISKEIKPDVIYCNHMLANPVGAYVGWKLDIPVVFHARNIHVAWFGRKFYTFLAKLGCVKTIICNSKASAELFLKYVPKKVAIIHNFLDTERFSVQTVSPILRKAYDLPKDAVVGGYVGRILPKKGVEVLIRAFHKIYRDCPKLCLVILGGNDGGIDVDLQSEYEKLCQALHIRDRVIFTGFQKDIRPFMSDFDFVLLPSIEPESFGRVLIEGMAFRLPSVTTAIGGAVEVIRDGYNGILVAPRNEDELAQAMKRLVELPAYRKQLGENGYKRLNEEFSSHALARKISEVFLAYEKQAGRSKRIAASK